MWILPKNLKTSFLSAQECVDLNVDLSELTLLCEQSAMWKSKPSSSKTWLARWNRVYWLKHLFGAILKPSLHSIFVERYTESLPVIHASHSALPEKEKEQKTQDTFFLLYTKLLNQLTLFGAPLKMSGDTYQWDMAKFTEAYEIWVIQLRQESSQRQKLAHHMRESDYSSLQWKTPTLQESEHPSAQINEKGRRITKDGMNSHSIGLADQANWMSPRSSDHKGFHNQGNGGLNLMSQVEKWATPRSGKTTEENQETWEKRNKEGKVSTPPLGLQVKWQTPRALSKSDCQSERERNSPSLETQAIQATAYPTPQSRDWKDSSESQGNRHTLNLGSTVFRQDQVNPNTTGKRPVLNPAWVLQLMGRTLEKTFFAWREMELSNKQRK